MMKLTFLGANHEVTGSRTLIEWRKDRYALVDCGMEQGRNEYENAEMPVSAKEIEYVFITHAHIDHTGMLPKLWRDGFRGTVYATRETCNLCNIMLADSAHIQESDAAYQTKKNARKNLPAVEPLYTLADVNELLEHFRPCGYHEAIRVDDGLVVSFSDCGHLMGSAAISLWLTEDGETRKIVFSGDVGNLNQPILNDPQLIAEADYVVVESTYGDRLHENRIDPTPAMVDVIQRTLDRGGNVIIPSFAVGRTQEMLYIIRDIKMHGMVHGHDGFPVYVDSPLANEATAVFLQCDTACLDADARAVMAEGVNPISFPELETVVTAEESKALRLKDSRRNHLRQRHVRRRPRPPSPEAQSLAAGIDGPLRRIPGQWHAGASAAGRCEGSQGAGRGNHRPGRDRHATGRQRSCGQERPAALAGRLHEQAAYLRQPR